MVGLLRGVAGLLCCGSPNSAASMLFSFRWFYAKSFKKSINAIELTSLLSALPLTASQLTASLHRC